MRQYAGQLDKDWYKLRGFSHDHNRLLQQLRYTTTTTTTELDCVGDVWTGGAEMIGILIGNFNK